MSAAGPERAGASEGSTVPVAADLSAAASGRAVGDESDALAILARELFWAGDPGARTPIDTGSVRERLHSFAHRLRIEARETYPSSETGLDRSPRLRRRTKRGLWYG